MIVVVLVGALAVKYYFELNDDERTHVKKSAADAFESNVMKGPLAQKFKADLENERTGVLEGIRLRIKGVVDKIFGENVVQE